jgi:hypothetical protein
MSPAEILAMIQLFETIEPPVQQAIAGLISKIHHKQLTAADYLALAQTLISQEQATPSPAP